jgi:hypothetical protein
MPSGTEQAQIDSFTIEALEVEKSSEVLGVMQPMRA